jgi:hypothetical protein
MVSLWNAEARPLPKEKNPAIVSYFDGLFMVTGKDKGQMLLDLFERAGLSYERVLAVDDDLYKIKAIQSAFAGSAVGFQGLLYTKIRTQKDPQNPVEAEPTGAE